MKLHWNNGTIYSLIKSCQPKFSGHWPYWLKPLNQQQSSFSQLGNSDNSAISVKGKDLTYVKMYVEKPTFQKVKFNYKAT